MRTQKRQAKRDDREEQWRSLAAEEVLAKKLRKGKISAAQFEPPGDGARWLRRRGPR